MNTTSSTTDTLEQTLLEDEVVIAQARGRQTAVLRELDRRQVSLRDGHRSPKEWATERIGLASETAATLVTTARRLEDLPNIDAAVPSGEIGFDLAVAVGRLAGRDDALDLLSEPAGCDIDGIRTLVTRRRRIGRLVVTGVDRRRRRDRGGAVERHGRCHPGGWSAGGCGRDRSDPGQRHH